MIKNPEQFEHVTDCEGVCIDTYCVGCALALDARLHDEIAGLRFELDRVRNTVKQAYQRLLISDGDAIALSMLKIITEDA